MNKLKINESFRPQIESFQKALLQRDKENDKAFKALCKEMKIGCKSQDGDILWDHIFNNSDWMVEYTKK